MTFRQYSKMKDSRIEWIGDVPEHWDKRKISWLFHRIGSGTTPDSHEEKYYNGNIPWVNSGDLKDEHIIKIEKNITNLALEKFSTLKFFPKDTLIIAMYGASIGKLGILTMPATVNQACCALCEPKNFHMKFLFYWFIANRNIIISQGQGGGQPNISQELIKNLILLVPTLLDEQKQIADFLDREISKINLDIQKYRKIIELLIEKRQIVTNQALTKGLNPNVQMKDSGIKWIGKIPEHWNLTSVKFIYEIQLGKMLQPQPNSSDDVLVTYFNTDYVQWYDIKTNDLPKMWINPSDISQYLIKEGDLLVCEGGSYPGRAAITPKIDFIAIIQNALHRIRPSMKSDVKYLLYLLFICRDSGWIDVLTNKTTMGHLTREKLASLKIPFPELIEQKQIVDFIDNEFTLINSIIQKTESQIEKLQEFRQAIISEAVTGKIDVRQTQTIIQ